MSSLTSEEWTKVEYFKMLPYCIALGSDVVFFFIKDVATTQSVYIKLVW